MTKNNKKSDGHLIGVWKGELMKGEWYGKISWSENGTWSGEGKWEQEQLSLSGTSILEKNLSGTWKVRKGSWVSEGKDIGKWKGSGIAKVEGRVIKFKKATPIILVAVVALILNIIAAALNVVGGLEWSTNIINIVISVLLCLMVAVENGVGLKTQEGKWQIEDGKWIGDEEYRILYLNKGTFKLGPHKGKLLGTEYLFTWGDNLGLKEYLVQKLRMSWVETKEIETIDNTKTITSTVEENKNISLKLSADGSNSQESHDYFTKVNLEIDDGVTKEFISRTENGKQNIYSETENGKVGEVGSVKPINSTQFSSPIDSM
jgi:hypothetical protein